MASQKSIVIMVLGTTAHGMTRVFVAKEASLESEIGKKSTSDGIPKQLLKERPHTSLLSQFRLFVSVISTIPVDLHRVEVII